MSTEAPPPHEPRVKLRWERVPDWDDPEGYPETPEAFHAALKQRVREYYIAQEEEREFDRVYKWCLQKSGNNRHEECREFRKYRMNRIHWPLGLPPAGVETDSVCWVRPNVDPEWMRKHFFKPEPFNPEAKWR